MTNLADYKAEQAAVAKLRASAMRALLAIWSGDIDLAKRVTRRVLDAPPGGTWKDGCPRCVIDATAQESGRGAHELQRSIHIDDWTALANLPMFQPALLGEFLADGIAQNSAACSGGGR
jgi:hypothetical protein